jgi:transposase
LIQETQADNAQNVVILQKQTGKNQAEFCCKKCGYSENADYNAAKNIAARAVSTSLLSSAKKLSKIA